MKVLIISLLFVVWMLPSQAAAHDAGNRRLMKPGAGNRILMIGDSHTAGFFGKELESLLRKNGKKVHRVGKCETSPRHWLRGSKFRNTPALSALISSYRPNVVLILLGANMRRGGKKDFGAVQTLARIARESGAKVVWVGPPKQGNDISTAGIDAFDAKMRRAIGPNATYVAMSAFTSPLDTVSDRRMRIHAYDRRVARRWAGSVFQRIHE
jgi:hypothetical protein